VVTNCAERVAAETFTLLLNAEIAGRFLDAELDP
jgi:hypothetical protein